MLKYDLWFTILTTRENIINHYASNKSVNGCLRQINDVQS